MLTTQTLTFFSHLEILKLINIVGIAVESPIGNYPDLMTWRVTNFYPGSFTSISDILTVSEITYGKMKIKDISTKKDIDSVIPIFDDDRIHTFLKTYAPNILEYSAGNGMRRIKANVLQTYNYTLAYGGWKMVEVINKSKADFNLKSFVSLIRGHELSIGNHFNHVLAAIKKPKNDKLSYYIANNGILIF